MMDMIEVDTRTLYKLEPGSQWTVEIVMGTETMKQFLRIGEPCKDGFYGTTGGAPIFKGDFKYGYYLRHKVKGVASAKI